VKSDVEKTDVEESLADFNPLDDVQLNTNDVVRRFTSAPFCNSTIFQL